MSNLPEDVIINILLRLPVKSIIRFRCVCKQWLKLFSDRNFIKLHFSIATENENLRLMVGGQHIYTSHLKSIFHEVVTKINSPLKSNFNYPMFIVGSCNGLICIANKGLSPICIWNPCTKMFKNLPTSPLKLLPHHCTVVRKLGFGYDFHNEEYKVVTIWDNLGNGSIAKVHREGSNTRLADQLIPYSFKGGYVFGELFKQNLHWIAYHCSGSEETRTLIVSFSISDESFGEMPLPDNVNDLMRVTLGVLGGDLCVADYCDPLFSVDIWIMKDYGVNGSWIKLLTIPLQTTMPRIARLKLLHSFKNGLLVFMMDFDTLLLYHPKYSWSRSVKIKGIPAGLHHMVTFVGSLFPVNAGYFLEPERSEEVSIEEVGTEQSNPGNKIRNFVRGFLSIFKYSSG